MMSAFLRASQLAYRLSALRALPHYSLGFRALSTFPEDRKYTKSHEWAKLKDGVATVGISSHAQSQLGEIVFVELPEVGSEAEKGSETVAVESVKATADVYAPLNGEVVEVNEELSDSPELINKDPHAGGWLFKIKVSDPKQLDELMSSSDYEASIEDH